MCFHTCFGTLVPESLRYRNSPDFDCTISFDYPHQLFLDDAFHDVVLHVLPDIRFFSFLITTCDFLDFILWFCYVLGDFATGVRWFDHVLVRNFLLPMIFPPVLSWNYSPCCSACFRMCVPWDKYVKHVIDMGFSISCITSYYLIFVTMPHTGLIRLV